MSASGSVLHPKGKSSPYSASPEKKHNSPGLAQVKADLRLDVMAEVKLRAGRADVFDAFCGPVGEQYERAWRHADSYVGCDTEYRWPDARRRFVGDNRRIMRAIDLQPYNVFDLDSFGSPWEQMVILAERRTWAPGEVGAIVLTDSSHAKMNLGGLPKAIAYLLGMTSTTGIPPTRTTGDALQPMALAAWAERSKVEILSYRKAESRGSLTKQAKGFLVIYSSVLFVGRAAAPVEAP